MGEHDETAGTAGAERAEELGPFAAALIGETGAPVDDPTGAPADDPARDTYEYKDHGAAASPQVVETADAAVGAALAGGAVVAVPSVGGYCLAVRVGTPGAEARIEAIAADPDGPHYAVGHLDDVRALTSGWTDEVERLLERCWPGPVDVFLPRALAADDAVDGHADEAERAGADEPSDLRLPSAPGDADRSGWAVTVGMPDGRALRRLCKQHGPWRTVPLTFNEATEVARAFGVADVALVVDGGRRDGELPTLVDATVTPVRVLREGALPSNFIDATMAMGAEALVQPLTPEGRLTA